VLARPGVVDRRWPLTAAHGRSSRTRVDVVSTKVRGSELGWACRMAIGMATPPGNENTHAPRRILRALAGLAAVEHAVTPCVPTGFALLL
jgi:hypothetical protein